eukprot:TRINITY_DN7607_c0_g1_i1.p1 TRINITY_DN7607_c0_g1~~TRINITY_DN7607_c0_g1_i1.p1  ORF type:complete len:353 (+),score=55.73 TRINITY_DN7607_c0_g1_i1:84-1142(+)
MEEESIEEPSTPGRKKRKTELLSDSDERKSRAAKACITCQRSHVSCGSERPCKRCADRGIAHLCIDGSHKKRGRKGKYLNPELEAASSALLSDAPSVNLTTEPSIATLSTELFDLPDSLLAELMLTPMTEMTELRNASSGNDDVGKFEPPFWLPSTMRPWCDEFFEYMKLKIPEEYEAVYKEVMARRTYMQKVWSSMTKEMAEELIRDCSDSLASYKKSFKDISVPAMVFDRGGIIHYVNQSFIDMTGFDMKLPTERNQFAVYELISPRFLTAYMRSLLINSSTAQFVLFPAEIRSYGSYIDASLWITFKKNRFGLVPLFVATVIPAVNTLVAAQDFTSILQRKAAAKAMLK